MRNLVVYTNVISITLNDEFTNKVNALLDGKVFKPILMNPTPEVTDKDIIDFQCGQDLMNWDKDMINYDAAVFDGRTALVDKSFYYKLGIALVNLNPSIQVLCDQTGLNLQATIDQYARKRKKPKEGEWDDLIILANGETTGDSQINLDEAIEYIAEYGYPAGSTSIDSRIEPNDSTLQILLGLLIGYSGTIYTRSDVDPYTKFIVNKW